MILCGRRILDPGGMTSNVLVGADAAGSARALVAAAKRFGAAIDALSASAARLADQRTWQGAAAERFRREQQDLTTHLRLMSASLTRMASGAQSVIDTIDLDDALGALRPGDPVVGSQSDGTAPGYPPVYGWDPKKDGKVIVDDQGAFQPDHGNNDYGTAKPFSIVGMPIDFVESLYAEAIADGAYLSNGPESSEYFKHYLDGTGTDKHYDSTLPYQESDYFKSLVDSGVQPSIQQAEALGKDSFDSGYIYDPSPFPDNKNWYGAVNGSFRRYVGHRAADGTWVVTLQMTSYYQFRNGQHFGPFGLASGRILHDLERHGDAKNFRLLGTGTILYDSEGNPIGVPA